MTTTLWLIGPDDIVEPHLPRPVRRQRLAAYRAQLEQTFAEWLKTIRREEHQLGLDEANGLPDPAFQALQKGQAA